MRLAVCFFGNLGWELRDSQKVSLDTTVVRENIAFIKSKNKDVLFFGHCWSSAFSEDLRTMDFTRLEIEPQKSFCWDGSESYSKGSLKKYKNYLDRRFKNNEDAFLYATRSKSRWYSTCRSLELMKHFISDTGVLFDNVLFLRYDVKLKDSFSFDMHLSDVVLGDSSRYYDRYVGKKNLLRVFMKTLVGVNRISVQPKIFSSILFWRNYLHISDTWILISFEKCDTLKSLYLQHGHYHCSPHIALYELICFYDLSMKFNNDQGIDYNLKRFPRLNGL
jgi:hypothetical protein